MTVIDLDAYRVKKEIEATMISRADPRDHLPFIKGGNFWAVRPGKRQEDFAVGRDCARQLIKFYKENYPGDWGPAPVMLERILYSQQEYKQTEASRFAGFGFWRAINDHLRLTAPGTPTEPDDAPWFDFWWLDERGC